MKKTISLLLALIMLVALFSACDSKEPAPTDKASGTPTETASGTPTGTPTGTDSPTATPTGDLNYSD